jgi:hypothetical protein
MGCIRDDIRLHSCSIFFCYFAKNREGAIMQQQELTPYHQRAYKASPELNFLQAIRQTYPAHYTLFNNELYFSNMLITDWRLRDRAYQIVIHVANRM